jgi:hypothetical protein
MPSSAGEWFPEIAELYSFARQPSAKSLKNFIRSQEHFFGNSYADRFRRL